MDQFSFLNASNIQYFSDLYERYLDYPDAVEPSWRAFFQGFDFALQNYGKQQTLDKMITHISTATDEDIEKLQKEFKVLNLISDYQKKGHLFTNVNPLKDSGTDLSSLDLHHYGLSEADLNTVFDASQQLGIQPTSLSNIIHCLQQRYCQAVGIEFTHISDDNISNWIKQQINISENRPNFSKEEKVQIFNKLSEAVIFENFLHTKYVGQKRFSLEGGESLIPALDFLIESASDFGVEQLVLGMAHRGRLNVLVNVFGKSPQDVFSEFDGKDYEIDNFDGDVKYHLGITHNRVTHSGNKIILNLVPNPSHLETVASVVEGISRAKQDKYELQHRSKVLPIVIHGDAAVAGQGIVYEVIQMSMLEGYKTEGTIHIVVNNQVGFTTNYTDARSSVYCTDIAKVVDAPVIHVNSDSIEDVVYAMKFALHFRMKFKRDVFIDILGYRKYGHNEGDEPRFTQPKLYKMIAQHQNPRQIYLQRLQQENVVNQDDAQQIEQKYRALLEHHLEKSRQQEKTIITPFMHEQWKCFHIADQSEMLQAVDTTFPQEKLSYLAECITELPSDKKFINKVRKIISDRRAMYFEKDTIDWGMAEHLAFASLLSEGYDVRLSGEDVQRGTFSHRHAVIKTEDTEETIIPLNQINNTEEKQGSFYVYNSLLSEYGVLGFEYGYALSSPNCLTIWEAQFGDFANGAQIITDQYISCGESKWKTQNGLVQLLPHGYEGQGAEHSSARIERYLQLCATDNMYVINCTTPANFFHLLRRQMKTSYRKPVVVFSPKSLLRHPQVVSSRKDLSQGCFLPVIDDASVSADNVKTLVFCSGKFYYDLFAERDKLDRYDVALVRIEQLFPLPISQLKEIIARYPNVNDYVWAQEEPKNMGAYSYMLMNFNEVVWRLASPQAFSAPASGSYTRDRNRHQQAINQVFINNKEK